MAGDVIQALEEVEGFEEKDEGAEDDEEKIEETAEEIEIDDGGHVEGGGRRGFARLFGAAGAVSVFDASGDGFEFGFATAIETPPGGYTRAPTVRGGITAITFHARKENDGEKTEDQIAGPDTEGRRDDALTGETGANNEEEIVRADNDDGEERAGGAASSTRLCAERNRDESEDEASNGKGEALVKFDASIAPGLRGAAAPELREKLFREAEIALCGWSEAVDFDGPIAATEGGNGIMVGIGAGKFVGGTAVEVDLQLALLGLGNYNRTLRESDLGAAFRSGFSEKHAVPMGATGGNIVQIQDHVREALVEDARLNLEGDLRGDEVGFDVAEIAEAEGCEVGGHEQGEQRADEGDYADGDEDASAADAQGGESDDFAVHGHAAEAEHDADENGHGNSEDEHAGENAGEELGDLRAGAGMADEEFHEADEFGDEENECEDEKAEEGVASYFANNIAVENAHGREKGSVTWGVEFASGEEEKSSPQRWQRGRRGSGEGKSNAEFAEGAEKGNPRLSGNGGWDCARWGLVAGIPPLRGRQEPATPVGMTVVVVKKENPRGRRKAAPTRGKSNPRGPI